MMIQSELNILRHKNQLMQQHMLERAIRQDQGPAIPEETTSTCGSLNKDLI